MYLHLEKTGVNNYDLTVPDTNALANALHR